MSKSIAENIIAAIVDNATVKTDESPSVLSQLYLSLYADERPEEKNNNFAKADHVYCELLEIVGKSCSLQISNSLYETVSDMLEINAEEYFKSGVKCGMKLKSELEDQ